MATVVPIQHHPDDSGQSLPKAVRDSHRYAQHGLALPQATLRALKKRRICCQTFVTLEYQRGNKRYVLRGTESGGAVEDMGHYCAFLDATGEPIPWLQPIDSLAVNGRHAVVIAPALVRIEMLRVGRTYELILTAHNLITLPGSTRPRIGSRVLYRGQQGTLAIELWKPANRELRGELAPVYYRASGEVRPLPAQFERAVRLLVGGVCCVGCKHSHVAVAPMPDAGETERVKA
jgi:hypothetical protein